MYHSCAVMEQNSMFWESIRYSTHLNWTIKLQRQNSSRTQNESELRTDVSENGEVRNSKSSLAQKSHEKNWQILSESTFSEHWKLTKSLQQHRSTHTKQVKLSDFPALPFTYSCPRLLSSVIALKISLHSRYRYK